jgi:hypothetical protein
MMEAVPTSETSVDNHFTRQYNPEDNSEHHSPSASLSIANLIWADSGMNPGLRKGEYLLNVKAGGTYISHLDLKGQLEVKQQYN